ncbi:MAG: 16S rRNA (adenine(1518)-N(6)/adenine(1519)-N(6))-dimethyltransferase RsmA [Bacteroidaceae bacterium]|nr:16S rRNA (adenine(1518)-N(6)/adenine(1519)-N(6))-dimethyltransferase RsmA [Bacteroidaceae bacterium]
MRRVRPKKSLGQHFLTDLPTAARIADTVDACPDLPILEVGPGTGVLTQFLLKKERRLRVVELDHESVDYLRKNFVGLRDEDIIPDDFLKMHLDRTFGGPFVLTGNYPYNISSQIFFRVVEFRCFIPCCTGMIQKEVAERLAAKPGCKDFGILSALVQLWYDVEYLFTVEPDVFDPPPKVRSAVVRLMRNSRQEIDCDESLYKRIVKTVFNQRRKMLRVTLRGLLQQLDNEHGIQRDHSALLTDPLLTRRPEQLGVEDFISLTKRISLNIDR